MSPNAGGDAEALTALLRDLHAELGDFGYEWLAACAVYPGLHWHLTVYLGAVLAKAQNARIPDENAHLAIARLPWFRKGSMPDDLRLRLIRGLEPECRETVRQAIKQLFYQAMVQPVDARDRTFEIDFARTPPPGWPYALRGLRAEAAPDAPVHDAIFVNYMVGRKLRPIDLRLDRALVTLFRARLSWSIRLPVSALAGKHRSMVQERSRDTTPLGSQPSLDNMIKIVNGVDPHDIPMLAEMQMHCGFCGLIGLVIWMVIGVTTENFIFFKWYIIWMLFIGVLFLLTAWPIPWWIRALCRREEGDNSEKARQLLKYATIINVPAISFLILISGGMYSPFIPVYIMTYTLTLEKVKKLGEDNRVFIFFLLSISVVAILYEIFMSYFPLYHANIKGLLETDKYYWILFVLGALSLIIPYLSKKLSQKRHDAT